MTENPQQIAYAGYDDLTMESLKDKLEAYEQHHGLFFKNNKFLVTAGPLAYLDFKSKVREHVSLLRLDREISDEFEIYGVRVRPSWVLPAAFWMMAVVGVE